MNRAKFTVSWLLLGVVVSGCAPGTTSFVRDDVDSSHVQQVAICPFQNRSQDPQAGARVQSVFVTELLTSGALRTLDPGETAAAMRDLRFEPTAELSAAQIVALGERLKVDALFFGSVDEYGFERASNDRVSVVTATFRLAETETGTVIWQCQVHHNGTSIWRKLFGGGSASLHDVTRGAVDSSLESLF
jgi:hypothetical protein